MNANKRQSFVSIRSEPTELAEVLFDTRKKISRKDAKGQRKERGWAFLVKSISFACLAM
jgi:hypothetical protein